MDIRNIYYENDFKMRIKIDDNFNVPFALYFWTSSPVKSYIACYDGKDYHNCRKENDDTLLVAFDDHHMGIGQLMVKMHFYLTDEDYKSGIYDKVIKSVPVVSVNNNGEQSYVYLTAFNSDINEVKVEIASLFAQ